jgi:LPXTG-motif cell wall-anchored protein
MRKLRYFILFVFVLTCVGICLPQQYVQASGDFNVPSSYPTIQAGINACATAGGGTVHVAAGAYTENITWKKSAYNSVVIQGAGAAVTTIVGSVTSTQFIDKSYVMEGFTITSTLGTCLINSNYASPTVIDCVFTNSLEGVYNYLSSPAITNCTFLHNRLGMYNMDASAPVVVNCIFSNNGQQGAVQNGGLFCNPIFVNCTFSGNTTQSYGAAMYSYITAGIGPRVINCIFWGDTSSHGPAYNEIVDDANVRTTMINSDVDPVSGTWPGNGNIDNDPKFTNAAIADYHLLPDSPCIDKGTNSYIFNNQEYIPATDKDGNSRIINGIADMGVYESLTPPPLVDTQVWYLDSTGNPVMEQTGSQSGSMDIAAGASTTWLSDQPATADLTFPSGAWTIKLAATSDWSNTCSAQIGDFNPAGSTFTAFNTQPLNGIYNGGIITITITIGGTVSNNDYLALRVFNGNGASHSITTDGSSSLTAPSGSPSYPTPEMPAIVLLGIGLVGLSGFLFVRKKKAIRGNIAK